MKISIITPSHDCRYLKELEDSILAQTYKDWEWIVLLNNGAKYTAADDKRIRVIDSPFNSKSVGALKKYACTQASGEIIAEVDHDDLLTTDCLEEVAKAFTDKEVGFVYSMNAKLADNFIPYDKKYGWSHSSFSWQGRDLIAMNNQPLTAGRLGYIWYAPDHVRAWRKSVYDSIGGHNEDISVCDDQDLMHRLYMATRFAGIEKVLYVYRITGNNTWIERNQKIQHDTVEIYHKNIFNLACRFADINNLAKIDLCGAFNKPAGFLSIDMFDADIIANLETGIPLPDNSVGIIRANDALEHVANQRLLMSEIHRVLAPGGMLLSHTPSTDGRGAWQDPTHVSFWNENSFWYWTRREQAQYIRNTKIFRECALYTSFPSKWHEENKISYVTAHLEKI
jgi:O-antigen biosynthesis protein